MSDADRGTHQAAARHMPSLDGIRAISFLLVFFSHAGLGSLVPGGIGVTTFFFLSGFLITTLMRVEYDKNGYVNLPHFWLRRIFRIFPPFYLVLLFAALASLILDPPGTLVWPAVRAQLLHFTNYWIIWHGYSGQPSGTGVYWSLAVEEHFYLIFPFLYVGMRKLRLSPIGQVRVLWGICALVLLWRCALVLIWHVTADRTYMGTDTRFDSIMFGCALAVWNNPALDVRPLNEARWKWLLVPGALAVLVGCLLYRTPTFRETIRYTLQGMALTVIFVAAIRFKHWLPFRFLNWRPIAFIGVLSYSLYLLHLAVVFAVERYLPAAPVALQGALALGIAFVLAWIMYVLVEKPAARWRRRLTD